MVVQYKFLYHSVYSGGSWTGISVHLDAPGPLPPSHELDLLGEEVVVDQVLAADLAPFCRGDVAGDTEVAENSDVVFQMLKG